MNNLFQTLRERISPRSMVGRISAVFALLGILLAGAQFLIISKLWTIAEQDGRQRLEWHLASELAALLQPLLLDPSDEQRLNQKIAEYMRVNPRIQVHLLDTQGRVIQSAYSPQGLLFDESSLIAVPLELLESALEVKENRKFPLYGPALSRQTNKRIFSVARVSRYGSPAYLYVELSNDSYRVLINGLESVYITLGGALTSLIIFLLVSILGFFAIRGIAARFRGFAKGIRAIADGELETRVAVSGSDEISQLGERINQMAARIQESVQRLEENDRWRRQMTAALSHDLKSPIASLQAHSEQLQEMLQETSDAEVQDRLEIFRRNLVLMNTYVDEILEVARLEAGDIEPDVVPFDLKELLEEEIVPQLAPICEKARIPIEVDIDESVPLVYADIGMIERVLLNLLSNSIKYNESGCEVRIKARLAGTDVRISVSDNGVGIDPSRIQELLTPFTRGDAARSKRQAGSGLGLAIVKLIVQAHGQELEVYSRLGEGTKIAFLLPTDISKAKDSSRPLRV